MLRCSRFGTLTYLSVLTALLLGSAIPVAAADSGWNVKVMGAWLNPGYGQTILNDDGDEIQVSSDSDWGYGLAIERRFSPRLSAELSVISAASEIRLSAQLAPGFELEASDNLDVMPISAAFKIHLLPEAPVDVYLGPVVAHVSFGDLRFSFSDGQEQFSTDSDLAFGLTAGADFGLGESAFFASLAATYLDCDLEAWQAGDDEHNVEGFDPLLVTLGIGYRF